MKAIVRLLVLSVILLNSLSFAQAGTRKIISDPVPGPVKPVCDIPRVMLHYSCDASNGITSIARVTGDWEFQHPGGNIDPEDLDLYAGDYISLSAAHRAAIGAKIYVVPGNCSNFSLDSLDIFLFSATGGSSIAYSSFYAGVYDSASDNTQSRIKLNFGSDLSLQAFGRDSAQTSLGVTCTFKIKLK